jgi:hypothetical protein
MEALVLWEIAHFHHEVITERTGVSKSSLCKLIVKALSRGWIPTSGPKDGGVLETWHVDDAPRFGRPPVSTTTTKFIIETMTKHSTTRA